MSFVKYRVKEVATDFGKTPKEIAEIISKYYEKPKSNTQVLTEEELNALFDDLTRNNKLEFHNDLSFYNNRNIGIFSNLTEKRKMRGSSPRTIH